MLEEFRISLKYILFYKKRSFSVLMSFTICISFLIGFQSMSSSAKQSAINKMAYETGSYHVIYADQDEKSINKITSNAKQISKIGFANYIGAVNKPQKMNLWYADEEYINQSNAELLKGRLAIEENEIALEKWVITNLSLDHVLGTEFEIQFAELNGEKNTTTRTLKLVGILEDRASKKNSGILEGFVSESMATSLKRDVSVSFYKNKNIKQELQKMNNLLQTKKGEYIVNQVLVDQISDNQKIDVKLIFISLMLFLFCFLIIGGIFQLSILQRRADFGIMKAIGADQKQIFQILLFELLLLFITALLLGTPLGIFAADYLSQSVSESFLLLFTEGAGTVQKIQFSWTSFFVILLCGTAALFPLAFFLLWLFNQLTVIQSIRKQSSLLKINISPNEKNKPILFTIMIRNIARNKFGFLFIIATMVCGSSIFLISEYAFQLEQKKMMSEVQKNPEYFADYVVHSSPIHQENGLTDQNIKQLETVSGSREVLSAQCAYGGILIDDEKIDYPKAMEAANLKFEKSYGKILDKVQGTDKYLYKGMVYGYDKNLIKKSKNYLLNGSIDEERLETENLVLFCSMYVNSPEGKEDKPMISLLPGDKITVKVSKEDTLLEEMLFFPDTEIYEEIEFTVSATLSGTPPVMSSYLLGDWGCNIIMSDNTFKRNFGKNYYKIVGINKKKSTEPTIFYKEIVNLLKNVPDCIVNDSHETSQKIYDFIDKKLVFVHSIVLLFLLIALIGIINQISFQFYVRQSEFGILLALGLEQRRLKRMIFAEGIFYGAISFVIAIVFSITGQFVITAKYSTGYENAAFFITPKSYLFIFMIHFLIGVLSVLVPIAGMRKMSVISSINKEE